MKLQQIKPLRTHIQEFLEQVEADYQYDEDNHCFTFGLTSNGMGVKALVMYNEENSWMRCHILMPAKVPEDKRVIIILLLNRMNNEFSGICLSMDEEDGEIIATMLVNTDEGAINHKVINAMIQTCYNVIDNCIPKVMRIIYQQPEDILLQMTENQNQKSIAN